MEKLKQFWHKDGTRSVMASLLCILLGLAIGFVVLLVINPEVRGRPSATSSAISGIIPTSVCR